MSKKNSSKRIRFNYFVPSLVDITDNNANIRWDMKEFFEFILNHNHNDLNTAVPLGDEIADLEWNTANIDEKNELYYCQLSKNRSKDIPSKKKLNHDKVPLELEDDEYIGEFNLIVYDARYNLLIVQSNFFGLTVKQISTTLSILRQRIKDAMGKSEKDNPKGIILEPLIDPSEISKIKKHKIYRRIIVKGSDYNFAAADDYKESPLNKAINYLRKIGGVNFNIELSMSRSAKNRSLDADQVRKIIDEVLSIRKNDTVDVAMSIASKANEEDPVDVVNLIEPRLTSEIVIEVENRATIGSEYIYTNFCEQNYLDDKNNMREKASRVSGLTQES
ncbi:hypothetical protein O2U01_09265 [Ligilactobacillus salivarius]|uniref:Uncharacterized protein n=1 Tax=Ligilactobacillus salivarius TaxID=1624 RepID=A0ABD7YSN4_9LACO|nr:DUF6731 family protein [Ligilactobacillus salivarius]WHS17093.1 hypothetical protein O2U02_06195 [Ligilactobacillus salivarius]WHS20290.1 hypothetical protein O2U01_09265 [Ligilactobacillus salivarius]WHS22450.1 hypothetical protein O2U08_09270 [Ligilactobacillus salivarius]